MSLDNASPLELVWIAFGVLALAAGLMLVDYARAQERERRRRGLNGYAARVAGRNLRHGIERSVKALAVIVSGLVAALWIPPARGDHHPSAAGVIVQLCLIVLGGGLALSSAFDLADRFRRPR